MNLATCVLLIMMGVVICTAVRKSPQTKWEYSGESRKKLKRNEDDFESGDLLGYDHLTIVLVEAFILGIIFRIMKKDEDLLS